MAVDGQQALTSSQVDNMQVPTQLPVRLCAVGRRLYLQESLEGKGQAQFHHFASWGMVTFSTRSVPSVASATIIVIS